MRTPWPLAALCIRVAESVGIDGTKFEVLIDSNDVSEELESNCEMAVQLGVFGNPSFYVSEKMFWGQDRMVLVRHALERLESESK